MEKRGKPFKVIFPKSQVIVPEGSVHNEGIHIDDRGAGLPDDQ